MRNRSEEIKICNPNPDTAVFKACLNELQAVYGLTQESVKLFANFFTQVKRKILGLKCQSPYMLCLYNERQEGGKSRLAEIIQMTVNKTDTPCPTSVADILSEWTPPYLGIDPIIFFDEFGSCSKEKADKFKSLITNEGDIVVKEKYEREVKRRNRSSFILTTNRHPANFFFTDSQNRRLGIVFDFFYRQERTDDELRQLIKMLWDNAPSEYMIDPKEIARYNKEAKTENDVFLLFYEFYKRLASEPSLISKQELFTRKSVEDKAKQLGFSVHRNLIQNFMESNFRYFKVYTSGRVKKYRMLQGMIDEFIREGNLPYHIEDDPSDDPPLFRDTLAYHAITAVRETVSN